MTHDTPHNLSTQLTAVCQHLEGWRTRFPKETDELTQLKQAFSKQLARMESEGLKLSIGIMGQVKAGKSSFLNALLFDGKPVLPVAATPKTANLTRISFGESPMLTVEFYTPQEWHDIETRAAGTGMHAEAVVARDLLKMVTTQGLNVSAILVQPMPPIPADNVDGLMHILNDYVGENGKFTALVKSTEIQLPLEELKGFDVVDTPGMNDPVPSRTQKTRDYMATCDVVLFLSRASQFLDQSDMDLLARQLPGNGVKRMVLVAGQLDGAISDDGFDRKSLANTEANLVDRLSRRAVSEMEKLASFRDGGGDTAIATMLRTLKNPILASTFAHGFATWEPARWTGSMQTMHKELAAMANSQWQGYQITQGDWARIGNFPSLQAAYQNARDDKQALLQAQRDALLPTTQRELQRRLETFAEAATQRAKRLQSGDMASMNAQLTACEHSISVIAANLSNVVQQAIQRIDNKVVEVRGKLTETATSAKNVRTREGTDTTCYAYEVKIDHWYDFMWRDDMETRYRTKVVGYAYIATSDVIEKLVSYARESSALIEREFNQVIQMATLRTELKQALVNALDASSEGFDPDEFRGLFEGTLSRVVLPTLTMPQTDVASEISQKFSGEVRESDEIDALQHLQKQAADAILLNLLTALEAATTELCKRLIAMQNTLVGDFAKDLEAERKQLSAAFADKEQELRVYADIVAYCKTQSPSELSN